MSIVNNNNYESNMKHLVGNNPIGELFKAITSKTKILKRAKNQKKKY
tara:strand:+ start:191 stop:331 length:141 start_codon:yes stop_codon:yes gene_type:complete